MKVDELVSLAKEMIVPSVGTQLWEQASHNALQVSVLKAIDPKAAIEIYEKIDCRTAKQHSLHIYLHWLLLTLAAGEREKAIQLLREKLEGKGYNALSQDPHLPR